MPGPFLIKNKKISNLGLFLERILHTPFARILMKGEKNLMKLTNDWESEGDSLAELERDLSELEARTAVKKIPGEDMVILTYMGKALGKCWFQAHEVFLTTGQRLRMKVENRSTPKDNNWEFIPESKVKPFIDDFNEAGFIIKHKNEHFIVDVKALRTLGLKLGLGGEDWDIPSYYRDELIGYNLNNNPDPLSLVIRQDEGFEKVFAVLSAKFSRTPLTDLLSLIKRFSEFSEPAVHKYFVSNELTRVFVKFEALTDKATGLTPGVMIETSDVGRCGLKACGAFMMGDNVLYTDEIVNYKHEATSITKAKKGDMLERFEQSIHKKIFGSYNTMIEMFEKLRISANKRCIRYLEERVPEAVGKKTGASIMSQLQEKDNLEVRDLILNFYDIPVPNIGETAFRKLAELKGRLPFVKWGEIAYV